MYHTNTKYFKVFIRIDEALSNVEDPDILTEILLQTGAFHKKIPGFRPEMFWVRTIIPILVKLVARIFSVRRGAFPWNFESDFGWTIHGSDGCDLPRHCQVHHTNAGGWLQPSLIQTGTADLKYSLISSITCRSRWSFLGRS